MRQSTMQLCNYAAVNITTYILQEMIMELPLPQSLPYGFKLLIHFDI